MTDTHTRASWLVYALGALCAGAIVAAILVVGPASGSQATITRTATVANGVVQSTVSGSGNIQASSQLNLGFDTSGTVTHIYVSQGQHVVQGQVLARLDPQSAEVTLEQAKASLQSAEASLAEEEETGGEASSAAGGGGGTTKTASVSTASVPATTAPAATPTSTTPTTTPRTTPTTSTPATTAPATTPRKAVGGKSKTTKTKIKSTAKSATESSSASGSSSPSTSSAATKEANLASARAAVKSDKLTVQSDEQAVQDTKLYAPEDGTLVSLSGQVGEVVSGSGTTKASSSAGSSTASSASGSGAAATGATASRTTSASGSSTSGSSGSSSSSSSAFAILSDLSSMELVVPLSESEIGNVKVGQIAAVTVEALEGRKLAAHVSEVSTLSTSNSGVVSYDVTFALDQLTAGLKPGMSATAEVVVKQAEGINVPSSAITANAVTVARGGKHARRRVVTGLAGDSSTIVLSGLKAGETIVLPTGSATSSSGSAALSSRRSSALGGGVGPAGGPGGVPGGGGAFFRGGG